MPDEQHTNQFGMAVMEFALILPVLFVLACIVFDGGRALREHHAVSILARELGNTAFRRCPESTDGAAMNTCLTDVGRNVMNYATGQALPEAQVVVRLYRYNAADPWTPILSGQYRSGAQQTRYTNQVIAGSPPQTGLASYNATKGFLITSEVFYRQTSLLGTFAINHYQTTVY